MPNISDQVQRDIEYELKKAHDKYEDGDFNEDISDVDCPNLVQLEISTTYQGKLAEAFSERDETKIYRRSIQMAAIHVNIATANEDFRDRSDFE